MGLLQSSTALRMILLLVNKQTDTKHTNRSLKNCPLRCKYRAEWRQQCMIKLSSLMGVFILRQLSSPARQRRETPVLAWKSIVFRWKKRWTVVFQAWSIFAGSAHKDKTRVCARLSSAALSRVGGGAISWIFAMAFSSRFANARKSVNPIFACSLQTLAASQEIVEISLPWGQGWLVEPGGAQTLWLEWALRRNILRRWECRAHSPESQQVSWCWETFAIWSGGSDSHVGRNLRGTAPVCCQKSPPPRFLLLLNTLFVPRDMLCSRPHQVIYFLLLCRSWKRGGRHIVVPLWSCGHASVLMVSRTESCPSTGPTFWIQRRGTLHHLAWFGIDLIFDIQMRSNQYTHRDCNHGFVTSMVATDKTTGIWRLQPCESSIAERWVERSLDVPT